MPQDSIYPDYARRERIADGAVHIIGVVACLAATTTLMIIAWSQLPFLWISGLAVYSVGAAAMFLFSAGYHMTRRPEWREVLQRLDHAAIFIMIAGTYTPFALIKIGGAWGLALLAAVWIVAIVGVTLKLLTTRRFERSSIVLYLVQGWAVLVAIEPLSSAVSALALALLAIGGGLYTFGVAFHVWRSLPYHNAIWHGFVLAGASCHYTAILDAVALAGPLL